MAARNLNTILERNSIDDIGDFTGDMVSLLKEVLSKPEYSIDQFAMQVVGQVEDRTYSYIYDKKSFDRKLGKILRQLNRQSSLQSETPIMS